MYTQVTQIHVPLDGMAQMRTMIEQEYLPAIRRRPGFVGGLFLEQVDDPEAALLIIHWDSHEAVENFNRTGSLEASVHALAVRMPGVRAEREGYVVRIHMQPEKVKV